jgi:hypothetical protein
MKLKTPSAPFSPVFVAGESITLETDGKVLVLPTSDNSLPLWNQKTLDTNRLTITESPWGGLKGTFSDGCVGTVLVNLGDGIYLQDPEGSNTSKELGAGKLVELGYFSVDTSTHSFTVEFSIVNTSEFEDTGEIICRVPDYLSNVVFYQSIDSVFTEISQTYSEVEQSSGARNSISFSRTLGAGLSERLKLVIFYDDENRALSRIPDLSGNNNSGVIYGSILNKNTYLEIETRSESNYISLPEILGAGATRTIILDFELFDTASEYGVRIGLSRYTYIHFANDNLTFLGGDGGYIPYVFAAGRHQIILESSGTVNTTTLISDGISYPADTQGNPDYNLGVEGTSLLKNSINDGFVGKLYKYIVFDRSLTSSEKENIFNRTDLYSQAKCVIIPTVPYKIGSSTYEFSESDLSNLSNTWIALLDAPRLDILPDNSGNGNNGIMTNVSLSADALGNPYGAISFNGSSSYVDCGSNASIASISNSISIEVIAKRIGNPTDVEYIICNSDEKYGIIFQSDKRILFVTKHSNGSYGWIGTTLPLNDNWNHIVVTYSTTDETKRISINGSLSNEVQVVGYGALATNGHVNLGSYYHGYSNFLNGYVAKCKIYNRVLSQTEITTAYNNQPVSPTGLVASWQPYQPSRILDFFLHTHRPKQISFKKDETGNIHELTLYPGNGSLNHGQLTHYNPSLDSDSNGIPDVLEPSIEGSLTKFLQSYGMI